MDMYMNSMKNILIFVKFENGNSKFRRWFCTIFEFLPFLPKKHANPGISELKKILQNSIIIIHTNRYLKLNVILIIFEQMSLINSEGFLTVESTTKWVTLEVHIHEIRGLNRQRRFGGCGNKFTLWWMCLGFWLKKQALTVLEVKGNTLH